MLAFLERLTERPGTDKAHTILAGFYTSAGNSSGASTHLETAASLREGILDLTWDPEKLAFYDFNLTSNARNSIYTLATFYPLWNDIVPTELLANSSTRSASSQVSTS